jgi:hypothetical protein
MVHSISEVVRQFKREWTKQLEDKAIEQVCREQGMRWRQTLLNPIMTIKIFFLQILHGNTACEHLRRVPRLACPAVPVGVVRRVPLSNRLTAMSRLVVMCDWFTTADW